MVSASEHISKSLAVLSKAVESASTQLSIVAVLGLALVPLLPDQAASTLTRQTSPAQAAALSAPVELVRAKAVPVPETTALPVLAAPPAAEAPTSASILEVALRRSRNRHRGPQQESGDMGKAGANARAEKTPVAPADPKSEAAKVEPPEPDVWSDAEIIAALKDCLKRLAPLGAEIEIAPAVKHEQCGAPAPVLLKRIGSGPNRVEFQPAPMLNCAMVTSLHTWIEKTLQPAAQDVLGSPIVRLRGTSGYACRNRNGTRIHSDRLSEHALANAIDIMGFVTADGRTIDVASRWGPTARDIREQNERLAEAVEEARAAAKQAEKEAAEAARAAAKLPASKRESAKAEAARKKEEAQRKRQEAEQREAERRKGTLRTAELQKLGKGVDPRTDSKAIPATAGPGDRPSTEALFLRRLHKGACTAFGTVLGPEANEAHRDHFHFDLAPRKRSAFCE